MRKLQRTPAQEVALLFLSIVRRVTEIPTDAAISDARLLALAEDFLKLLKRSHMPSAHIERRGRPRTHDVKWANDCLIAMAIESPDGLASFSLAKMFMLPSQYEKQTLPSTN